MPFQACDLGHLRIIKAAQHRVPLQIFSFDLPLFSASQPAPALTAWVLLRKLVISSLSLFVLVETHSFPNYCL